MPDTPMLASDRGFLAAGETGALIAGFDWASTPLGPIEGWPASLKTMTGFMLRSPMAMVILWGPDGVMLYNDAYSAFAGGRHPGLVGRKVREAWPEAAEFNGHVVATGLAGGTLSYRDMELTLHRNGAAEQVWMDLDYSPILDDAGDPGGVMATVVETTQRVLAERRAASERQLEQALLESELRFRNMADNAPVMMWVTDPRGVCTYLNRRWYEFTGQPPGGGEGYGWLDAVHPDDRPEVGRAFAAANAEQRDYRVDFRLRRADGVYRWSIDAAAARFTEAGEYLGYVGSVIDIEDRREMEDALRAGEARLRELNSDLTAERNRIWEMSRDLFAIMGFDGRLKAINPAWEETLGFDQATLLARDFSQQVHPDDHPRIAAMMEALLRGDTVAGFEDRLRHCDGSWRWISWTLVPQADLFYAVGRDVTAEKHAAAELERAQEALRQSQKMDAMGQLTGGVAHDFNNLLTPIIGSLDMLQRRGVGGEREQRLIEAALQSADRAKTLVQRLLAFARRQPLKPTAVDVAALVAGMADLVASTSGPQIKLVVDAAPGLAPASADPNQLEMAILNLAVNARDAMPDGGTLTLSAANDTVGEGAASGLAPGTYVRLAVTDTGTGMDEETMRRAVEPFFSTKGIGKGTGLGLSMVHGLASQLGGALKMSSHPGLGTKIELWLPASAAEVVRADGGGSAAQLAVGAGTALLVDDEAAVRASTADMLIELGYGVVEADSADAALRILASGHPVDLLLTDHLMPGMTGTALAREVRSRWPGCPVLLISGFAEVEGVSPDLLRLTKPFRQADLAAMLATLVR